MTAPASLASRILLSLSLALAASTAACANVIVNGGGSSDGGGGSTSGTHGTEPPVPPGTSGSGTPTAPQAIAVPYSYILGSVLGNGGTGDSGNADVSTSGGGGDTDERLFLEVGNETRSCTRPEGSFACGTWLLSIALPPAFQHPGTFPIQYDKDAVGNDIFGGNLDESVVSDEAGGLCSGSGGPLLSGTVTILEINATHVAFTVQGIPSEYFDVDGSYDAPRCGP